MVHIFKDGPAAREYRKSFRCRSWVGVRYLIIFENLMLYLPASQLSGEINSTSLLHREAVTVIKDCEDISNGSYKQLRLISSYHFSCLSLLLARQHDCMVFIH